MDHGARPRPESGPLKVLAAALGLTLLTACAPPTYLDQAEARYGVGRTWYGSNLRVYHSALLDPAGFRLRTPGYVVGVENIHPDDRGFADVLKDRRWREHHIVTHVLRYGLPDGPAASEAPPVPACALFTLLDRSVTTDDPEHRVFQPCHEPWQPQRTSTLSAADAQGNAIAKLRQSLTQALKDGNYTHILFMVMGWNTDQENAIKNFNSLTGNLADGAARWGVKDYTPLVIGVTWPSEWALGDWSVAPAGLVRLASFPAKRRDANDTGKNVVREVLRHAVLPAREAAATNGTDGPHLVMIGHSFGARALVKALASETVAKQPFHPGDRVVLLEGAFEFKDLYQKGGRGPLSTTFAKDQPRLTITASAFDQAVAAAVWGLYAGDIDTFDQACNGKHDWRFWRRLGTDLSEIGCGEAKRAEAPAYGFGLCARDDGRKAPTRAGAGPVRYLDATKLTNCTPPFSGGGAHSDIFRPETANFLWDEMR